MYDSSITELVGVLCCVGANTQTLWPGACVGSAPAAHALGALAETRLGVDLIRAVAESGTPMHGGVARCIA
jgi:hypothetical protein